MSEHLWIWQRPDWPQLRWNSERLAAMLRACATAQGRLLGMTAVAGRDTALQESLDSLLQNILTSSAT